MVTFIDEILNLQEKLEYESLSHLKQKSQLSLELKDLTNKEITLTNQLSLFKKKLESKNLNHSIQTSIEIEELLKNKNKLKDEIKIIKDEISKSEEKITKLKAYSSIVDSEINIFTQEKDKLLQNTKIKNSAEKKTKYTNIKTLNEKQKLEKIRMQLEKQKEIYNNLTSFLKAIKCIEEVLIDFSDVSNDKVQPHFTISESIRDQIISAKKYFDLAQSNYQPNNIIPFLVDADKAYRSIISVFIKLNVNLPNYLTLSNENFSQQVFSLVKHGLKLNTKHLNAVKSMLVKSDKGVEIAPLASFVNEIRNYFVENLSIFGLTKVNTTLS